MSTGNVHQDWTPTQKNSECFLVLTTRHRARTARTKEPEQTAVQPTRPAAQQGTLYKQLVHARTLSEHSIEPYIGIIYLKDMLQDSMRYETEVPQRHTGPPHTTTRTAWENLVANDDKGSFTLVI